MKHTSFIYLRHSKQKRTKYTPFPTTQANCEVLFQEQKAWNCALKLLYIDGRR